MTLRAGSSAAAFAVVVLVVVALVADAIIGGHGATAVRIGGGGALVVWAAWMLLVRPSIRVLADRAVVVNLGRITELPWGRIVDIRRRLQLIFDLDDGATVEAWGSPFPRRRMLGRTARSEVEDPPLSVLRGAWMSESQASAATGAVVVRRADILALGIGAVAVIVAVLSLTVRASS